MTSKKIDTLRKQVYNLWGTTIYNFKFDFLLQSVTFSLIDPTEGGENDYYQLIFYGLKTFSYINPTSMPGWNYVELSEIEVERKVLSNGLEVIGTEILLWFSDTRVLIESTDLELKQIIINDQ